MDFIEDIRVSDKRAEAGFGAEVNRPTAILDARKIGRISVAEFSPAEADEVRVFLLFRKMFRHLKNHNIQVAGDSRLRAPKNY